MRFLLSRKLVLHVASMALVVISIYSNTLDAPFIFDDQIYIDQCVFVRDFGVLIGESVGREELETSCPTIYRRLVGYASFALNYRLRGFETLGYHVMNVAIHITNGVLVYFLIILILKTPFMAGSSISERSSEVAFLSALIFLCHPVQTQAVTYISQRFASMATMFYLASIVSYALSRLAGGKLPRVAFYIASLVFALLAMRTKEIAFTLPLAVALYEFSFHDEALKKRAMLLFPIMLMMLIIPYYVIDLDGSLGAALDEATRTQTEVSRTEYLFTQFRVISTYLRLLALPINQNLDYDYPIYRSFYNPVVSLSFALIIVLFIVMVFLYRWSADGSRWLRLPAFALMFFVLALSVESSVIALEDVIFEHRLYLPMVGFSLAVSTLAIKVLGSVLGHRKKKAFAAMLILTMIMFALLARTRNAVWNDPVYLYEDMVKKSPNKGRPHYGLGLRYLYEGRYVESRDELRRASSIDHKYLDTFIDLARVYASEGQYEKGIKQLRMAVWIEPSAKIYLALADLYISTGQFEKAYNYCGKALVREPGNLAAQIMLNRLEALIAEEGEAWVEQSEN